MSDRNRKQQELREDRMDHKEKKVANVPDKGRSERESTSNTMSKGDLTNNRQGRERTATPHSKTYITGTDDDGQNV